MKIHSINGKITGLELNNNNLTYNIKVKTYCVINHKEPTENVGKIIEDYRKLKSENKIDEANEHWVKYKSLFENFISNISIDSIINSNVVQVISTSDLNRQELINNFAFKITDNLNNKEIQVFTDNFTKTNAADSIKSMQGSVDEKAKNFLYKQPDNIELPLQNLIIIDDIINEGETIQILLHKMIDSNVIDNKTNIQCFIIYSNENIDNFKKDWKSLFK